MRTPIALALVFGALGPWVRAQPPRSVFYHDVEIAGTHYMYELWRTHTDNTCFYKLIDISTTAFTEVRQGTFTKSCEAVAKTAQQGKTNAGPRAALAVPDQVKPEQTTSSPSGYLWILSDTAPDSAPATDDAVYAVDPQTFDTDATILTPGPIPLAIAAGNTGQYVYATIQGVPAGESGIPAHPPLVEVISTSTLAIVQTIDLPDGANPGRPALSPDDRYVYVPSNGTAPGLLVVDTQNPSSVTAIPVMKTFRSGPSAVPVNAASITPDGELLFLIETAASPADIYVIDTATGQQIADLATTDPQLNDLVLDPTGSRLYVAGQMTVYGYNTATLAQIGSVLTRQGVMLGNIGITLDGSMVYANDQNSTAVFAIDPVTLTSTESDGTAPPPFPSGETPASIILVQ